MVRIRYRILSGRSLYYGNSKRGITTNYQRNELKSVGDVSTLLKESFKDLLQELLEAELDVSLGYDKSKKDGVNTDNKRNGHFPKTVKSAFGELQLDIPRDRNGEFEPEIVQKYCRDISGIEEKVIRYTQEG